MKEEQANCCTGKVVGIAGDQLTTTSEKGKEQHHTIAKDAKVTCDGKASKASALKAGTSVRMTTCKDDADKVLAIDSGKTMATASH